jgi:hypothetical protein
MDRGGKPPQNERYPYQKPVALLDPSDLPGVVGDTWPGAGRTSELLGFGWGTGAVTVGCGICAAALVADKSRIVKATTAACFVS